MLAPEHHRLTRSFFRGVTSTQLFRRFFAAFGVWDQMGLGDDAKSDAIITAWEGLAPPNKGEIDEALFQINDLSQEKAHWAVIYCAENCRVPGYREMTPETRAFTLFMDHRQAFDATYQFHAIEKTENLRSLVGRVPLACAPTQEQLGNFKEKLGRMLQRDAYGRRLLVEVAPAHPKKWLAAIPHQTLAKADFEFDEEREGEIVTRTRRPIYEMILIYYPERGLLKLKVGRGMKKLQSVAACFAEEILGQDADFFRVQDVVSFAPLRNPQFAFTREPTDHFTSVRATMIQYRRLSHPRFEHSVQCKDHSVGSPDVLDQLREEGIKHAEIEVEALSLRFQFPGGARDTSTVELGVPNRSTLDDAERGRYLERVLVRWGFLDLAVKEMLVGADAS